LIELLEESTEGHAVSEQDNIASTQKTQEEEWKEVPEDPTRPSNRDIDFAKNSVDDPDSGHKTEEEEWQERADRYMEEKPDDLKP